jgi:hypothetical protein
MDSSSSRQSRRNKVKRPWLHYLLVWPIVLEADKDKRSGRLLTPREWLGWGIVAVVIVLAVIFT